MRYPTISLGQKIQMYRVKNVAINTTQYTTSSEPAISPRTASNALPNEKHDEDGNMHGS
jgi:hypothetical protein